MAESGTAFAQHSSILLFILTLTQQLREVRQQLGTEAAAKNEAVSEAHALQQELTAVRVDSARQQSQETCGYRAGDGNSASCTGAS